MSYTNEKTPELVYESHQQPLLKHRTPSRHKGSRKKETIVPRWEEKTIRTPVRNAKGAEGESGETEGVGRSNSPHSRLVAWERPRAIAALLVRRRERFLGASIWRIGRKGDWFGRKGVAGGWYVGGLGFGLARLKRGCACTRHGGPC